MECGEFVEMGCCRAICAGEGRSVGSEMSKLDKDVVLGAVVE